MSKINILKFAFYFWLVLFSSCNSNNNNGDKLAMENDSIQKILFLKKTVIEASFNSAAVLYDSIIKDAQAGLNNEDLKEKYKFKRDSIGQRVDSVLNEAYQIFIKNHLEKKEYDKFIHSLDNKDVSAKAAKAKSLGITF